MKRLALSVLSVAAILAMATQVAHAASWSVQSTPNPTGPASIPFSGVSCSSESACTAVGYYNNIGGASATSAEAWNGSSWTIQSTPNPTGAGGSQLTGVSCSSASACTAVGYYANSGGFGSINVTLAEAWNGTAWKIQPTPNPTGAQGSFLNGVSCTSASACTAVGYYYNSGGTYVTLAEAWNGTSWKIQSTPTPTGAQASRLDGVSCTSASACTAVGFYVNSSGTYVKLAEAWNGSGWKIQGTPSPSGATDTYLYAVSCSSASACTAVGVYVNSTNTIATLAEAWNGSSWHVKSTPNPSGATYTYLNAVSCASASSCTAVGYYNDSDNEVVTFAEAWNGTTWKIQTTPNPTGATNIELGGVSCSSASACIAVGNYTNSANEVVTLAEAWNGSSWKLESTPAPSRAETSQLKGVSCPSASACTAVGYDENSSSTDVTLAEVWNGTSWTIQTTPNPTGAGGSQLNGVSCTSAHACTAIGSYYNGADTFVTLAEVWNGTSWTIQTTPNPAGANGSYLYGVSCTSASACTAVGSYQNGSGSDLTLAEVWNGTSWTIQTTPNPTGANGSQLNGVSCSSVSACTAVGYYYNGDGAIVMLAEAWNGSSWKIQPTPNPSGAKGSELNWVSCNSASACTAVGYYENSGGTAVTLAEAWNGTSWTIQTTPNPTGANGSQLNGVSCTSVSACTAVGYYENSGGTNVTLAEAWNGTSWTIQTTPNPTGALSSQLNGVSCTSANACTGAGTYNNGYINLTLAERYS